MTTRNLTTRRRRASRRATPTPDYVPPCLAAAVATPPSGADWVHEIKFDGYRLLARIDNDRVKLSTRQGLDWTARFTGIARALGELGITSALIDGEAIVEDERGASSFARLVAALKHERAAGIAYVAFDLLFLDGEDLRSLPLSERKSRLARIIAPAAAGTPLRYSEHLVADGPGMLMEVCKLGLEGIVSKRLDRPYRSGRNGDWLKAKCLQSDEFIVVGYLDSKGARETVGALVLAGWHEGSLSYVGRVGTGFTQRTAGELWDALQPLRRTSSPLTKPITAPQARGVRWVEPRLVVEVAYRAVTADRLLRHASFKAIREDLPAAKVRVPNAWFQVHT